MAAQFKMTPQVDEVCRLFDIPTRRLGRIKSALRAEIELGLRDEDAATVKMLITYVRELVRGDETGSYLALDLGGTNFRVLLVSLDNGRETQVASACHRVPPELLNAKHGNELFDYIALKLLEFVQAKSLSKRRISLGFTFSFPCKQYGLTQSFLVKWCKGYNVEGVVGTDVVKQLKDALKRQLAGLVQAYVEVVAVINDTTGTLVACANSRKDCRIGLIVGTGFNACYIERLDRCEKWPANYTNPKRVIINTEWGALGDNKQRRELDEFRNEFDEAIDIDSVNPRNQTYEKMVSGMYIGEMLRLSMLKLNANGALMPQLNLKTNTTCKLTVKDSLNGRHLSMLAHDELANSTNFDKTERVFSELAIPKDAYSDIDMAIVVRLASHIMHRSARLVACGISVLLERINKPFTVVGYDGSVAKHHPYFLKLLVDETAKLTPAELKFDFALSSDGSGIGAAVVAAALHKERRPLYIVKPGKVYEMHFNRQQESPQASSSRPLQSADSSQQCSKLAQLSPPSSSSNK